MLTRTIGTVAGAAGLTLGFATIENAAQAGGLNGADAFLAAFGAIFRICGIAAWVTAGVILWSAGKRRGSIDSAP